MSSSHFFSSFPLCDGADGGFPQTTDKDKGEKKTHIAQTHNVARSGDSSFSLFVCSYWPQAFFGPFFHRFPLPCQSLLPPHLPKRALPSITRKRHLAAFSFCTPPLPHSPSCLHLISITPLVSCSLFLSLVAFCTRYPRLPGFWVSPLPSPHVSLYHSLISSHRLCFHHLLCTAF